MYCLILTDISYHILLQLHTTGVHGLCSRAVNTGSVYQAFVVLY